MSVTELEHAAKTTTVTITGSYRRMFLQIRQKYFDILPHEKGHPTMEDLIGSMIEYIGELLDSGYTKAEKYRSCHFQDNKEQIISQGDYKEFLLWKKERLETQLKAVISKLS